MWNATVTIEALMRAHGASARRPPVEYACTPPQQVSAPQTGRARDATAPRPDDLRRLAPLDATTRSPAPGLDHANKTGGPRGGTLRPLPLGLHAERGPGFFTGHLCHHSSSWSAPREPPEGRPRGPGDAVAPRPSGLRLQPHLLQRCGVGKQWNQPQARDGRSRPRGTEKP